MEMRTFAPDASLLFDVRDSGAKGQTALSRLKLLISNNLSGQSPNAKILPFVLSGASHPYRTDFSYILQAESARIRSVIEVPIRRLSAGCPDLMPAWSKALTPPRIASEAFVDAAAAVERLTWIYERNTAFLRECFEAYANGRPPESRVRATYPFIHVSTSTHAQLDSRLSYRFVPGPGVYDTTVTRPDLFRSYLIEQIGLLIENHGVAVEVGESEEPIPIHFAYRHDINVVASAGMRDSSRTERPLRDLFDAPDLATMDDAIADGTLQLPPGAPVPLALFRAARIDYSLHRLYHYTETNPEHFQNFVVFTNYQFYIDAFAAICRERMANGHPAYESFVAPGNVLMPNARFGAAEPIGAPPERTPQMPAYHLVGPNCTGTTMVNIGTGPSNARNITDHMAVLRPHVWLMLGHCAGLGRSQKLGDYVLAHGYLREDHVLDQELPQWAPIPALAEVQVALEQAMSEVTGLTGFEAKRVMRTGALLHGGFRKAQRPCRGIDYATRTKLACPSSLIRLSDLIAIATSVTRRASSRDFKVSPMTRLYRLIAASTFERLL